MQQFLEDFKRITISGKGGHGFKREQGWYMKEFGRRKGRGKWCNYDLKKNNNLKIGKSNQKLIPLKSLEKMIMEIKYQVNQTTTQLSVLGEGEGGRILC